MKRLPKLRPCGWDALIAAAVLAVAVVSAGMVWGRHVETDTLDVVISVDGQEVERCRLDDLPDQTSSYRHHGYTLEVAAVYDPQQGIRVVASDCPTQDCVHTGTITRAGQSIVCLPARIVIRLEGGTSSGSDVDLVVG